MRTGLYPGTFDPITYGHLDIIQRAGLLVDNLVVGVAVNSRKQPLFTYEERVKLIERVVENQMESIGCQVVVRPFNNLLVETAHEVGASIVVRGLRAFSDFEYEFQMVGMNRLLDDSIETVFLMADTRNQAISSKLVKEIALLGGDLGNFVPQLVGDALAERFADQ